jgi:hypothetical protein
MGDQEETRSNEADLVLRLREAATRAQEANRPTTADLFREAAAAIVMLRSVNDVAHRGFSRD